MEKDEILVAINEELENIKKIREIVEKQLNDIRQLKKSYIELDWEVGKIARALLSSQDVFQNHKESLDKLHDRLKRLEKKDEGNKDMMIV